MAWTNEDTERCVRAFRDELYRRLDAARQRYESNSSLDDRLQHERLLLLLSICAEFEDNVGRYLGDIRGQHA